MRYQAFSQGVRRLLVLLVLLPGVSSVCKSQSSSIPSELIPFVYDSALGFGFGTQVWVEPGMPRDSLVFDRHVYTRGRFRISLSQKLVPDSVYGIDTFSSGILDSIRLADMPVEDSTLYAEFVDLQAVFSGIVLTKRDDWRYDTIEIQIFEISFDSIHRVTDVLAGLTSISAMHHASFMDGWYQLLTGVPNDRVFGPRLSTRHLFFNGEDTQFWPFSDHTRTRAWSHYAVKTPMTWDITMGRQDVVIGISDQYGFNGTTTNIDLVNKLIPAAPGNIRQIVSSAGSTKLSLPQTNGDGINKSTMPLTNGHGLTVVSCAISKANNDNLLDPPDNPQGSGIGTAPRCDAVLLAGIPTPSSDGTPPANQPDLSDRIHEVVEYYYLDVDFTDDADDRMKRMDVVNYSNVGNNDRPAFATLINAGIIQVAASGNTPEKSGTPPLYPAALTFSDPAATNNPERDVKVIAVGGTMDGDDLFSANCVPWNSGPWVLPPMWIGPEQITPSYVFSPGTDKFNTNGTAATRIAAKEQAYIDVVAPGSADVWVAQDNARRYGFNSGTSLSAPIVSGIVGLMLSVYPNMGVPADPITDLSADGYDVQRRAYNIITFTADKIADPNPVTYPYTLQTNDHLLRHWGQRNGFGRINAYRCVAHAIPQKADYEYTSTQTLTFSAAVVNENGSRLMHMGAHINDGVDWVLADGRGELPGILEGIVDVMDVGGTNIPGQVFQNQGVTRISSPTTARIDLTVPANSILAIDGKLITEVNTTSDNRVFATATGSVILMEGYLKNIELVGRLRIGDLTVDGSGTAPSLWMSLDCDVYGNVNLLNDAFWFTVGYFPSVTIMRTGSHARMAGSRNIVVMSGGTLKLDHGSKITRSAAQEVEVLNTGILDVLPGA